jgi:DNA-binding protein HU-beta
MERISKSDLIKAVAAATNSTQATVGDILDAAFTTIASTVASGKAVHIGNEFGSFAPKRTKAVTKQIPGTTKTVDVPAKNVIKFLPSTALKSTVNQ